MLEQVKDYYGKTLQDSSDLKTDACCTLDQPPLYLKTVLSQIHDEVMMRYYGCGLVAPEQLEGLHILDLGSGSGRDAYALSALVGEHGRIVGVDMTDEQLEVANRHLDYHRDAFGYKEGNDGPHNIYDSRNACGVISSAVANVVFCCFIITGTVEAKTIVVRSYHHIFIGQLTARNNRENIGTHVIRLKVAFYALRCRKYWLSKFRQLIVKKRLCK
jgi:SAM-dependent methyltransferase